MIQLVQKSSLITQLPKPSDEQLEQSNLLANEITNKIKDNNYWLSFKDFMNLALYHPLYGYYTSGNRKIGKDGDFITAPELGPLFAYGIARQLSPILEKHPNFSILEFGAGSGKLAHDLLLELNKLSFLPDKYYILDVSPELIDRQKNTISKLPPDLQNKISWLECLPNDNSFYGIIIANEVIDAMPVDLFHYNNKKLTEIGVTLIDNEFHWQPKKCDVNLSNYLETNILPVINESIPNSETTNQINYFSEVNLLAINWLSTVSTCLAQGLIMIIDYGFPRKEYYHYQRNQGTLMCHYRHFTHQNPLIYPGIQDITAHVDFTSLAEISVANDLDVMAFLNQAHFLLLNKVTDYFNDDDNIDEQNIFSLKQSLKKLTSSSEMGELFKFLLVSRNLDYSFFEHLDVYDNRTNL